MDWPAEFVCRISRSVMADPVILPSGHTYERRCIEAWFSLGQTTCVTAGTPLDGKIIIPNLALRAAITNFAKSRGTNILVPPSPELASLLAKRLISQKRESHPSRGRRAEEDESDDEEEAPVRHYNPRFRHRDFDSEDDDDDVFPQRSTSNGGKVVPSKEGPSTSRPNNAGKGGPDSYADASHKVRGATDTFPQGFSGFRVSNDHPAGIEGRPGKVEIGHGGREVPPSLATKPSSYQASSSSPSPSFPAVPSPSVDTLVEKLKSSQVTDQGSGAAELRQLTRASAENRLSLCTNDLIQALLPLMQSPTLNVQVDVVAAMVNLSLEDANKVKIVRSGVVPCLVQVLNNGFLEAKEHAAGAVFSLALSEENRHPIGALGAIPPLVRLLDAGPPRCRQDAALALYHLSFLPTNRSKLVKLGGVPILISLAQSEDRPDLASRSLNILGNIAAVPDGRAALLELNAIATLVRLLGLRADRNFVDIPEQAAAVLLLLSQSSNIRFKSMALQAGARELLTALATDGTPRARSKAQSLLSIIKESSEPDDVPRQYIRPFGRSDHNQMTL